MHHPVDYKITVGRKILIFRMFEGGCKSAMSEDDYADVVRQLFLAYCEGEARDIAVERMPELLKSIPDFVSYDVLSKLGSEKLRSIATTQKGRVSSWFSQEAGILEIK
jgi:hypothetical protein